MWGHGGSGLRHSGWTTGTLHFAHGEGDFGRFDDAGFAPVFAEHVFPVQRLLPGFEGEGTQSFEPFVGAQESVDEVGVGYGGQHRK